MGYSRPRPTFFIQFPLGRATEQVTIFDITCDLTMDLKLLLCFVMISPIFGENLPHPQNPQAMMELDRARSAWNFGGHHPTNRKVALAQWGRQRSSVPTAAIANRRQGTQPKSSGSSKKKSVRHSPLGSPTQSRQYKAYPKSVKAGKRTKVNRNSPSPASHSAPMAPRAAAVPQTYYPHPFANQQQRPSSTWNRGSRKLESRSDDSIMNKFRKEDLWHLDKGEGYPLKNEDLEYDNFLRNFHQVGVDSNSIENEQQPDGDHAHTHTHPHHHELEHEAENLVNHAEDVICNTTHETGEESVPNHIHHHHHYADSKPKAPSQKEKQLDPTKLTIAPLPRIHNPIPLGCLLTVPVFHPIRPRHQLACLISLPGTPNLMKRRRKRSADLQQQQQQPMVTLPQSQQQSMYQIFAGNQRMSQLGGTRKHYANHMGNGKSPMPPPSMNANLKVPATIIAPPKFDKSDLLSMLMGSGGVNPNEMGTILATNTRYVRFGRGLPNSGGGGTRQGRNLRWFPESCNNQVHNFNNNNSPSHSSVYPGASNSNQQQQQPLQSSSNQMPSMMKLPQQQQQQSSLLTKNNQISYSTPSLPQNPSSSNMYSSYSPPPPHKISVVAQQPQHHQQQQPSNVATPPLPLIVNVQIAPIGSRPQASRGPVITVPVPSSQQASYPAPSASISYSAPSAPTSYQTNNMAATSAYPNSPKTKTHGKDFKNSESWKPIYKEEHKPKPQKSFKYNYYSPKYSPDAMSESESKYFYNKVKQPTVTSLFDQLPEDYGYPSQTSNAENENEVVPQMEYYDHIMSNVDIEYAGESSKSANEDMINEYLQAPSFKLQNMDMDDSNKVSNNFKTFSFAVKRNNNNDNTNEFDFDMSPSLASTSDYNDEMSSSSLSAESSRDLPFYGDHDDNDGVESNSADLRTSETVSSIDHDTNNNYYYSLVRKLTGNIPDPIFINVPKDDPFSNEIKK